MITSKMIDDILIDTYNEIYNVYNEHKEKSKKNPVSGSSKSLIVFPKYKEKESDDDKKDNTSDEREDDYKYGTRISEQELRFIFVEMFNKHVINKISNLFYSVETPTNKSYVFDKDNGGPKVVSDKGKNEKNKGVSARIDLVIMAKEADGTFKRVALIEFKAHNPDVNDYRKDICKLINEEENNPECLKYFIQIVNVNNEHRTWGNIENKKITAIDALREEDKGDKEKEKRKKDIKYSIEYKCFNLNSKNIMYGIIKNDKLENIDYDTIDTECK